MSRIEEGLEELRLKLLDLTGRNRLLNFKHTKSSGVRIVDELPDFLAETLLQGDRMVFQAVPDPTEKELLAEGFLVRNEESGEILEAKEYPTPEEWARLKGLDVSYEVPSASGATNIIPERHTDRFIQTLLYQKDMEARLNKVRLTADSALQEMGANILFLSFGFLEWLESEDSSQKRLAPLYLMPVKLERELDRRARRYLFYLSYTGEDILQNISLKEKLIRDFGIELPDISDELQPDSYMEILKEWLKDAGGSYERWEVKRYISLSLLNFSKQLMYLDLAPERWGRDHSLIDHEFIQKFLGEYDPTMEADDNYDLEFGEERDIDELADIFKEYPLVEDADSSQHSALIDVVDGKNLIIQGPPGTGKSQTITNLIAASIHKGKKVLFVAEKMAALDVVKRRLDKIGLGEFCLELHSHKTKRSSVLSDIKRRLDKRGTYRNPSEIEIEISRFHELKSKLNYYARQINMEWKNTGWTRHEILASATRYRKETEVDDDKLCLLNHTRENLDKLTLKSLEDSVRSYISIYHAMLEQVDGKGIETHPWFGFENDTLQIFDLDKVVNSLESWNSSLLSLMNKVEELENRYGLISGAIVEDYRDINVIVSALRKLPDVNQSIDFDYIDKLKGDTLEGCIDSLKQFHELQRNYAELCNMLNINEIENIDKFSDKKDSIDFFNDTFNGGVHVYEIAESLKEIDNILLIIEEIRPSLEKIISKVDANKRDALSFTITGLGRLKSVSDLMQELDQDLADKRNRIFDVEDLDVVLYELRSEIGELLGLKKNLDSFFDLTDIPSKEKILLLKETLESGGFFKWFKMEWRKSRDEILEISKKSGHSFSSIVKHLDELAEYSEKLDTLNSNRLYKRKLKSKFLGIDTDIDELIELRGWYKKVRSVYGRGFGLEATIANTLFTLDSDSFFELKSMDLNTISEYLENIIEGVKTVRRYFKSNSIIHHNDTPLHGDRSSLHMIRENIIRNAEMCHHLISHDDWTVEELASNYGLIIGFIQDLDKFNSLNTIHHVFDGKYNLNVLTSDSRENIEILSKTIDFAYMVENDINHEIIVNIIRENPSEDTIRSLNGFLEDLDALSKYEKASFEKLVTLGNIDLAKWLSSYGNSIDSISRKNNNAIKKSDWLSTWTDYLRVKKEMERHGLLQMAEKIESGEVHASTEYDAVAALRSGIFTLLAKEIFSDDQYIANFSGRTQESIQKQFAKYDKRIKELQSELIAWKVDQNEVPWGYRGSRVREYTELTMLQHQIGLRRPSVSIRRLVDRSVNALTAIKPCFMMSPISVAQYLKPGAIEFDLVVMDEASQIKPEDALGVLARGKQIVVVGDPKQLPPTNFFNSIYHNEGERETILDESESILGAALMMFPSRNLRWHYRSRHESLIAFSNHEFYNGGLIIFPSPNSDTEEVGVKFHKVNDGCFLNRRNPSEARVVAEAVKNHLINRPKESLGVVAMNSEQRLQIESEVDALVRNSPELQIAYEENMNSDDPLFIKNLENVQGDERDVIFISMTYGPSTIGSRVAQRFGPINSELGWRRLNVLFTRSKRRMHVFSSMGSDDIVVDSNSMRGVRALKGMLKYCETGNFDSSVPDGRVQEPDSDFEIAVMDALKQYDFECVPQVGVAGFYIDIAVRDPGKPGRYLMGIECDGATYHSAKSARDRDRLRQEILEGLDWKIRRIWSTDWFRNPDGEIRRIVNELNVLKTDVVEENDISSENFEEITVESTEKKSGEKDLFSHEDNLKKTLIEFSNNVIMKELPSTPEDKRILRPKIIDELVEHRPIDNEEFLSKIPAYLRQTIDPKEGEYLNRILEIINAHEDEACQI